MYDSMYPDDEEANILSEEPSGNATMLENVFQYASGEYDTSQMVPMVVPKFAFCLNDSISPAFAVSDEKQLADYIRSINVIISLIIIIVGLVGNFLGVLVFAQKRFRTHSSAIYLLFICLTDGIFLIVHLCEDTLRSAIDVFLSNQVFYAAFCPNKNNDMAIYLYDILRSLNFSDKSYFACGFTNFLRYFLRSLSAHLIITFTIQRTLAIRHTMLERRLQSTYHAWFILLILVLLNMIFNLWVPAVFDLVEYRKKLHTEKIHVPLTRCDSNPAYQSTYFQTTLVYISFTMLLPIVIMFVCNIYTILHVNKSNARRQLFIEVGDDDDMLNNRDLVNQGLNEVVQTMTITTHAMRCRMKRNYSNNTFAREIACFNRLHSRRRRRREASWARITRLLLIMSFSYALFNLPYFITWFLTYYHFGIMKSKDKALKNTLFIAGEICEIFYVLNYACHFFMYCASEKFWKSLVRSMTRLKGSFSRTR